METSQEISAKPHGVEQRHEKEHPARALQWLMAGVGCMEVLILAGHSATNML